MRTVAARLTDLEKKKVVADYLRTESVNAAAKMNGISGCTARAVLDEAGDIEGKLEQKKAENTQTVEKYMADNAERVCDILDQGLELISKRLEECSPVQAATIMGILIDKHKGVSTQRVEVSGGMSLSDKLAAIRSAAEHYAQDAGGGNGA